MEEEKSEEWVGMVTEEWGWRIDRVRREKVEGRGGAYKNTENKDGFYRRKQRIQRFLHTD